MNGTPGKADETIASYATVRLELESHPESITLVRSMLGGLGEYLGFDPELLDDLKTAVSEACNNVVLHAYGDLTGPLLLDLVLGEEDFEVRVRDRGAGIQRVSARENRMGVGLAVISALANRAEFGSSPGEGTDVRMSFAVQRAGRRVMIAPQRRAEAAATPTLEGDVVASVSPVELLPQVLGRLIRAVAAGAYFTVDGMPGLHRLAEAVGRRAAAGDALEISFAIVGRPRWIEVQVGPLPDHSEAGLFGPAGPPAELAPILADVRASQLPRGELVTIALEQPPRH